MRIFGTFYCPFHGIGDRDEPADGLETFVEQGTANFVRASCRMLTAAEANETLQLPYWSRTCVCIEQECPLTPAPKPQYYCFGQNETGEEVPNMDLTLNRKGQRVHNPCLCH